MDSRHMVFKNIAIVLDIRATYTNKYTSLIIHGNVL